MTAPDRFADLRALAGKKLTRVWVGAELLAAILAAYDAKSTELDAARNEITALVKDRDQWRDMEAKLRVAAATVTAERDRLREGHEKIVRMDQQEHLGMLPEDFGYHDGPYAKLSRALLKETPDDNR